VLTRDLATYAIIKEVEAGRGSPHGGAYLSFEHCSESELRQAFGPVIDRLAANSIDLTRQVIEVAPIAHYHMGGVSADARMHMADNVGPLRTGAKLQRALATIADLTEALGDRPFGDGRSFDLQRLEWFDLRNMLLTAHVVTEAALARTESRGAHQREDFPEMS